MNLRNGRLALSLLAAGALVAQPVLAAVPSRPVMVTAQARPLKNVLEDIAARAGMRARVSPRLTTIVNGTWTGPADRLFNQFVRSMNLVVSEEGGVTSVYRADEVRSDTFATAAPAAVVREMRPLTNAHNKVRAGKGMVHVTGTPSFVASAERVAARMKLAPEAVAAPAAVASANVPLQPAPAADAPITSPSLGFANVASYAQDGRPEYEVLRAAPRGGYELRAYRLRYEQAGDRLVREGRYERVEPGVASRVRSAMGLGTLETTRRELRQSYVEARPPATADGATVNVNTGQGEIKGTAITVSADGPTVTADSARNMVIIRDLPSRMPQYEALIDQFDSPRNQIDVEVAIIDVSVDKAREYGIDLGFKVGGLLALFGGLGSTGALAGGGFVTNDGDIFLGRINGLAKRGIVRVTNRFNMLIRENATEAYTNVAEVAREVEGRNSYIAPFEAGTRITASPRIVRNGSGGASIIVRVDVEDAAFTGVTNQKIPTRRVTSFSGEPEVPLGKSIMIAGQTTEQSFEKRRKTPLLGDIPIAGELFKKGEYGGSRVERLFLITPRVLSAPSQAVPTQARAPLSFDEMDRARKSNRRRGI